VSSRLASSTADVTTRARLAGPIFVTDIIAAPVRIAGPASATAGIAARMRLAGPATAHRSLLSCLVLG
jgi:hypothetical protein